MLWLVIDRWTDRIGLAKRQQHYALKRTCHQVTWMTSQPAVVTTTVEQLHAWFTTRPFWCSTSAQLSLHLLTVTHHSHSLRTRRTRACTRNIHQSINQQNCLSCAKVVLALIFTKQECFSWRLKQSNVSSGNFRRSGNDAEGTGAVGWQSVTRHDEITDQLTIKLFYKNSNLLWSTTPQRSTDRETDNLQ